MAVASTSKTEKPPEKPDDDLARQDDDESSLNKVEFEFIETDSRGQ